MRLLKVQASRGIAVKHIEGLVVNGHERKIGMELLQPVLRAASVLEAPVPCCQAGVKHEAEQTAGQYQSCADCRPLQASFLKMSLRLALQAEV